TLLLDQAERRRKAPNLKEFAPRRGADGKGGESSSAGEEEQEGEEEG
ncbi:unnamed protein product, partial [Mesorhabditis spiculigera]